MSKFFENLNRKEFFNPSWVGVFTNPYFFIKRGIYQGVKANAKYLSGIILDLGCGSKPYQSLFPQADTYIGLDLQDSGHDHRHSQIDVLYDGKHIPFADQSFDSVLSSEVFEHVSELDAVLSELSRIMKPGAHLLVTVPFAWEEHEIPHDFLRFSSFGIERLLKQSGFELVVVEKTTNYVETVFQLWNAYVFQHLLPRNNYLKAALILLTITPVTLLGIILSRLLPDNRKIYLNNVIVVKK